MPEKRFELGSIGSLILFRLGTEKFCFDFSHLVKVFDNSTLNDMRLIKNQTKNSVEYLDDEFPLINLYEVFQKPTPNPYTRNQKLLLLNDGSTKYSFYADEVFDILNLDTKFITDKIDIVFEDDKYLLATLLIDNESYHLPKFKDIYSAKVLKTIKEN